MAKKLLITASVASMIYKFNMVNIKVLQDLGYEVEVACNFGKENPMSAKEIDSFCKQLDHMNIKYYETECPRSIFKLKQMCHTYKQFKGLAAENKYEIVHCQSPIGGAIARLALKKARKKGTKVIYTAHGFHFFKGAPLKNWLLFYPVERWLARYTDVLITINKEDYNRAKKSFGAGKVEYIPGVGINTKKFSEVVVNKLTKRKELGLPEDAFVVLSVGELNKNKNHETIIKAIAKINNLNVYYIICGQGPLEYYLKDLIKELDLEKQVKLLGYRRDIDEICKVADIFAFPSRREGLGMAALEAMASGLPIVTSNVHGIVDYSIDEVTGYTCIPTGVDRFAEVIERLINNCELIIEMNQQNIEIVKKFDIDRVKAEIKKIYLQV